MAALLCLRRRAAAALAGAAPKPQGLATAARHGALGCGDGGGEAGERSKNPWVQLPPFAPLDTAAAAEAISREGSGGDGQGGAGSNATAIRWVRRCCPHLPTSLVQKLFRLRKVKKNFVNAETSSGHASAEQHRLRRVSAKDQLVPGDILVLPVNPTESFVAEKIKKFDNKNEIDFMRSLEIYKDKAIIVVNKPPGMPVQGGVGIKNSIDVLAPMFEENSFEAPRLAYLVASDLLSFSLSHPPPPHHLPTLSHIAPAHLFSHSSHLREICSGMLALGGLWSLEDGRCVWLQCLGSRDV
ncbi:hypothetical protein ABZP36_034770 [Zizania latifolia]